MFITPLLNNNKKLINGCAGTAPIICVRGNELSEHPVPLVAKDRLVDTNGAGDAFVGGFLAQLVQVKK
jgi:adenosine kinase